MKFILTLDGGGYMGVLSSTFLNRLENELRTNLNQDIPDTFDLISGTSTGAIQAGCLAVGTPASVIWDIYVNKGVKLFKRNWLPWKPKYDRRPLMDEIRYIIRRFGTDRMHSAKTKLQINTVNLCHKVSPNTYFKSWKPKCKMRISDAIQYSFSAAYYFGASVDRHLQAVFGDGGEGNANCTIRECLIEASKLGWLYNDHVYIVSVGTGFSTHVVPFEKAKKKAGSKVWEVKQFINMARRQSVNTQLKSALEISDHFNMDFTRANIEVPDKLDCMDGLKYTREYVDYGNKMAEEYVPRIINNIKKFKEGEANGSNDRD